MSCQQNEHDANVISRKWMRCYEGHESLHKRVTDLGQESGLFDWWLYDEAPTITTTDSVGRFAFYFLGGNDGVEDVTQVAEVVIGTLDLLEIDLRKARIVFGSVNLPLDAPAFNGKKGGDGSELKCSAFESECVDFGAGHFQVAKDLLKQLKADSLPNAILLDRSAK